MRTIVYIGIRHGVVALIVTFIITGIMLTLGIKLEQVIPNEIPILFLITSTIIIASLVEELIFRVAPIYITQKLTDNKKILWMMIILSSIVFGYMHGSILNIPIQGTAGIILSMAFLKGGYKATIIAHATFNAIAIIPFILI